MDKMKTLTVNGKTYEIHDPSAPRIDNETVGDGLWSSKKIAQELSQADDTAAIVRSVSGEMISMTDASNRKLRGLTLYGKTTQDGTPTPDAPVAFASVGEGGVINITIGEQTLTAPTPNGLPGIPVSGSGNYTDDKGQQWVSDERDYGSNVYVRRTASVDMGDLTWNYNSAYGVLTSSVLQEKTIRWASGLCTHYTVVHKVYQNLADKEMVIKDSAFSSGDILIIRDSAYTDGTTFKNAMKGVTVLYELAAPIETPLAESEKVDYSALHTNKPNTTVFNDSNAGMTVEYAADTKTYIDNKFNELAAALVNNT